MKCDWQVKFTFNSVDVMHSNVMNIEACMLFRSKDFENQQR